MHRVSASRMTPEYLERRGFLQGIDSIGKFAATGAQTVRQWSWKDLLRPAKWKIERQLILRHPTSEGVGQLMADAHFAGMRFHQDEVLNDPKLLEWVLKPDYFDYRLPPGWETYLGHKKDLKRERPHQALLAPNGLSYGRAEPATPPVPGVGSR